MAFLNKAEVESYAEENGIDLTGMTWPQKQKTIADHMKENGVKQQPKVSDGRDEEISRLKRQLAEARAKADNIPIPQTPVVFDMGVNHVEPTIEDYDNVILMSSPEQPPTQYQRNKYEVELGRDMNTSEVSFDVGQNSPFINDGVNVKTATYRVEETNRKVIAEETMPKYSCLLTYRPTKDLCAVAQYGGHRGYLWTHHRLPNIKAMLDMMGVYEEYRTMWQKERGRLFYLGGLLCCDIPFTNEMFKKIQREIKLREKAMS